MDGAIPLVLKNTLDILFASNFGLKSWKLHQNGNNTTVTLSFYESPMNLEDGNHSIAYKKKSSYQQNRDSNRMAKYRGQKASQNAKLVSPDDIIECDYSCQKSDSRTIPHEAQAGVPCITPVFAEATGISGSVSLPTAPHENKRLPALPPACHPTADSPLVEDTCESQPGNVITDQSKKPPEKNRGTRREVVRCFNYGHGSCVTENLRTADRPIHQCLKCHQYICWRKDTCKKLHRFACKGKVSLVGFPAN